MFPPASIRSRAARRATSPGIDTDKSLKDIKPPSRTTQARPSVLAAQHAAGVSKKSKRGRKSEMSAKARRRHEKGLEMAEAISERTSRKVQKSLESGRNVKERAAAWEKINKVAEAEVEGPVEEAEEEGEEKEGGWETDDDMAGAAEDTLTAPPPLRSMHAGPEPAQIPLPPVDDDDEIL